MQWLLFLLCPLMMILMMTGLMSHKPGNHESTDELEGYRRENNELRNELSSMKEKIDEKYEKPDH